jgi:hypothetical protein
MFVISVSRFYVAKLSSRKNIINSQAFPFPSHYLDGTSEYTFAFIFKERNLIRDNSTPLINKKIANIISL